MTKLIVNRFRASDKESIQENLIFVFYGTNKENRG